MIIFRLNRFVYRPLIFETSVILFPQIVYEIFPFDNRPRVDIDTRWDFVIRSPRRRLFYFPSPYFISDIYRCKNNCWLISLLNMAAISTLSKSNNYITLCTYNVTQPHYWFSPHPSPALWIPIIGTGIKLHVGGFAKRGQKNPGVGERFLFQLTRGRNEDAKIMKLQIQLVTRPRMLKYFQGLCV